MKPHAFLLAGLIGITGCAQRNAPPSPAIPKGPDPAPESQPEAAASFEGPDLSLEQAVWLALRNQGDLQVQRLNPLVAESVRMREAAQFSSELFGEVAVGEETARETARSTGEQFNVEAESRESELGVRKAFASGTDMEVALREMQDASNRAPRQQELRAELTLTQALLRGRGTGVNLIAVQQAELGVDASLQELRGYTQALVAETEAAYWRYHAAVATISIAEQALDVAEKQWRDTQSRIEVGQLAPNDEAAPRAEVARRKQVVIEAQAERDLRQITLMSLIDPGNLDAVPLPVNPIEVNPSPLTDREDRLTLALKQRPDLLEARLLAEQNRLETIRTRNGVLPRLDFFAQLAKTGFGQSLSEARSGFTEDPHEWQVGLRLLVDLGDSVADADQQDARIRHQQSQLALTHLEQLIDAEVRRAWVELERARQQITASRETRRLQEASLTAEQERFEVGSSTPLLVAQAQRDLLQSQIEEQRSLVDYRLALIRLETAEGSLLERRGVVTTPAAVPPPPR